MLQGHSLVGTVTIITTEIKTPYCQTLIAQSVIVAGIASIQVEIR